MTTVHIIPTSPLETYGPYCIPRSASPEEDEPETRGRDTSPRPLPNLHARSVSPARAPLEFTRRKSSSSRSSMIQAHHTLSSTSASNPVLYLPPLLSPLPLPLPASLRSGPPTTHEPWSLPLEFATRLPDIDPASLALHRKLHEFKPIDNNYSTTPYDQAFNWDQIDLPEDIEREWYCVVFRSRRKKESSSISLYQADREAHEEAVKNGGLVMYWYGAPDAETGSNLATCIWQSRKHAINAISGPKHHQAMLQAEGAYEVYDLERWVLTKRWGEKGISLEVWQGGDVGW